MVFYFTATGNCLYVAKELDGSPISIPKVKQGDIFEDDKIGIVAPVYGGELPNIVLNFIKASTFKTPYLYMVLTYGHDATDSAEYTYNQCKALGKEFNYVNNLLMVDNYLPNFDIEKEKAIDKKIPEQLSQIKSDIESGKNHIPTASQQAGTVGGTETIIDTVTYSNLHIGDTYTITGDLHYKEDFTDKDGVFHAAGDTVMENGKAKRVNKKCEFCLACIHACPNNAIALKREKNQNARFLNENININEIINSNNQEG